MEKETIKLDIYLKKLNEKVREKMKKTNNSYLGSLFAVILPSLAGLLGLIFLGWIIISIMIEGAKFSKDSYNYYTSKRAFMRTCKDDIVSNTPQIPLENIEYLCKKAYYEDNQDKIPFEQLKKILTKDIK